MSDRPLTIYAENFRGFRRLEFGLEGPVFLVGDNSSGKTSILNLIDYVLRTDLDQEARFDEGHFIEDNDFTSAYFDHAPVIIGFHSTSEQERYRIITIERKERGRIRVTRSTTSNGSQVLTLVKDGPRLSAKLKSYTKKVGYERILKLHKSNDGLAEIEIELKTSDQNANALYLAQIALNQLMDVNIEAARAISETLYQSHEAIPKFIGPLRTFPERFHKFERRYTSTGAHVATLWVDINARLRDLLADHIREFGRKSGLFDDFAITQLDENVENSPIYIKIMRRGREFYLNQMGVGVSQVMPVLVELAGVLSFRDKQIPLIQQPELHLHPRAQSEMGKFLFQVAERNQIFVAETHSDYVLDRFCNSQSKSSFHAKAAIVFCENTLDGNVAHILPISPSGEILRQPPSYRSFFIEELTELL